MNFVYSMFDVHYTLSLVKQINQEKHGLSVQRKIPHNYIVCQLLPLEDASSTPQYLKKLCKKLCIVVCRRDGVSAANSIAPAWTGVGGHTLSVPAL